MRAWLCLCVLAGIACLPSVSPGFAETVVEAWRSPFGDTRAVAVNPSDNSCWVAAGASVMHIAANGGILSQTDVTWRPQTISVNQSDGSCWVAGYGVYYTSDAGDYTVRHFVTHLAADGTVLLVDEGFASPRSVSVNPTDGSCWVADDRYPDWSAVVHLAADGSRLSVTGGFWYPTSVSVNPVDGSCWVTDNDRDEVVHLSATGAELWRGGGIYGAQFVCVDPSDGSCWVACPSYSSYIVHLAASGEELCRAGGLLGPTSLSVNPTDGSCWVSDGSTVLHLAADCTELLRLWGFDGPCSVSANSADGSCWVAEGSYDLAVHLRSDGEVLLAVGAFSAPVAVSVDAGDGSCWVADSEADIVARLGWNETVIVSGFTRPRSVSADSADGSCWVSDGDWGIGLIVHLASDGAVLWQGEGFSDAESVSANPTDGSCWVADTLNRRVVHLAANGAQMWSGPFDLPGWVAANPADGTCWVCATELTHLASNGAAIWSGAFNDPWRVSVDPTDGSCWLIERQAIDQQEVVHLSESGVQLWQRGGFDELGDLSVDPVDGSCWVAYFWHGEILHFAADGTEMWRGSGFWGPRSVCVDPYDGSCWVADSANGQVALLVPICSSFSDVSCRHWALAEINGCAEAGIVRGYDDGTYRPDLPVSRDQMAVYISRALAGGDDNVPDFTATPTFPDVSDTHWALKYVEYAVDQAVVTGYDDGSYHPEYNVTRDQMAVYVARALVAPSGEAGLEDYVPASPRNFPDVATDFWAYTHIEYCVENGVVQGYDDGLYHPDIVVTRDQMAVYIARAFELEM